MLAAVHIHPGITIPLATILAATMVWYWFRLGREDVPPSRRRIRRTSIVIMAITLPIIVQGLSLIDPDVAENRRTYIALWTTGMMLLLAVFLTAVFDILNNVRVHADQSAAEMQDAAVKLVEAVKRAEASENSSGAGSS